MFKDLNDKAWLIGGVVRDLLLGLRPKDIDYCIEHCSIEEYQSMFPEHKRVDSSYKGKSQPPVFIYPGIGEVALYRIETSTGNGYNEFEYKIGCSIEEDLSRRDFSINTLAQNYLTGEIIDPYNGISDLKNGIIRAISDNAFIEDPLRIIRGIRFACRFEFSIEPVTYRLMKESIDRLIYVNYDRIQVELKKVYEQCDKPSKFFTMLDELGGLGYHFHEFVDAKEKLAGKPINHPEGSTFNHLMESFDRAKSNNYSYSVAIAAMIHDLGKVLTPDEVYNDGFKHIGHESNDVILEEFLSRHRFDSYTMKLCKCVFKNHMRIHAFTKIKRPIKLIRFVRVIRKNMRSDFIKACNCDSPLTQQELDIWNRAVFAVENTHIVIPKDMRQDAVIGYIEQQMTNTYKELNKGE